MNKIFLSFIGIMIPFIGTTLGSGFVFFLKSKLNIKIEKLLMGFTIGVMLSASIFSLLIPSIELSNSYIKVSIGFILGFLFLIIINLIVSKIESNKLDMLMLSVTIHNIPEGMAVGVCFAGFLSMNSSISIIECMLLSICIAIQNIPEGMVISMPLKLKNKTKLESFIYGVLSGVVEPLFAFITILLLDYVVPLLPYFLSFASSAMIYVIIEELVPSMDENKSILGIIGVLIGFLIMMILDLAI